ncbi:MAG: hypothetical protein IJ327_00425, partial [Lachnospiraceae bacterium]|nr:hypothetical protein [Lachnospiraceae bacterium]
AIIHHHTPECYVNGTETADSGFYANVDRAHTGTFGIQAYDSVDYTGIRAQAYKWPATLRLTTSKANAFSTPGTGTLHFTVATEEPNVWGISGTSLRDEDADYQIYVHDAATDACLYYLDLDSLAYSVSSHEERICSSAGCTDHTRIRTTYSFDNGIVSGYRTKAPHTGYINHSGNWDGADSYEYFTIDFHLPIAETTNGIYVNMVSTFRYAEDVIGVNLKLKNMSYSYAYQTCNREEGEIIAATKAYGGSNYVNSTYCTLVSTKAGVGSGNGSVDIHLSAVECIDNMELHNVAAKDMAAPDRIQQDTISKRVYDGRSIKVEWKRPKDRGTVYCHQVSGHEVSHGDEVCRSNITENIMESGIKGYYFLEDEYPDTQVTLKNGRFSGESSCLLMLQAEKRYLHVAAMDVAGNLSESVHVPIWEQDEAVPWPIATQPITLWSEEDNIYPAAEREWYVRGDGETAFTLYLVAGMPRGASKGYQINYLDFLVDNGVAGGTFSICVPNCEIEDGEYEYDRDQLTKSILGASFLEDAVYTRVVRSNRGNCLEAMQKFVIDAGYDGQRLHVIPSAGAQWQEQVVRSDTALDVPNGLWLRVDGEAPEIGGVDALSGWSSKEGEYVACFTAEDGGSGMREFYCTIVNKDQYVQREIRSTDGQYLELRLAETDPLLAGDVEIRFLAVDNVGNRRYMVVENPFFSMTATVERILSPHEPLFKAGESGRILVDTYGFARRLEVRYPSDWAEWGFPKGENFDYGQSTVYHRQEQLQFMVPLKAREGSYEFEVKAYKEGGGYLEQTLQIQVKGSILDELHTRLR